MGEFGGKQMFSDITVGDPFSYNLKLDADETTTLKPQAVKKAHQKGKFSYMFRQRGMP